MTPLFIFALIIVGLAIFAESPGQQQQQQTTTPTTPAAMLAGDLSPTPGDNDPATRKPPEQQHEQQQQQQEKTPPGEKKQDEKSGLQVGVQELIENATKPLRDELAALKASPQALEKERRAYDSREDFIRTTMKNFPAELARKLIPASEDQAVLQKAGADVERMVKGMMDQMVASGRMKYADVGGGARDGGSSLVDFVQQQQQQAQQLPKNATPQQLLASDLEPSLPAQTGARRS